MKKYILSLSLLAFMFLGCEPKLPCIDGEGDSTIGDSTIIEGIYGPDAYITILRFENPEQEDYLVAGHPLMDYSSDYPGGRYFYDETSICFANNPYHTFLPDLLPFIENELNICGTSPYVELAKGYVMVDWKWHYVLQMSLISNESLKKHIDDMVKNHVFCTNILWEDLNSLSPQCFNDSSSLESGCVAEVRIASFANLDLKRGQKEMPDKDFRDYSYLQYREGLSTIQAAAYYADKSPKYAAYLSYCDSMQNVYQEFLVEYINNNQLLEVSE